MQLTKSLLHTTDSHIKRLADAGIVSVKDFVEHYPRAIENRTNALSSFSMVNVKEKNALEVTIESILSERTRNGKNLTKMIIRDANGYLSEAVWFTKPYFLQKFHSGDRVKLYGKAKYDYGKLSFPSPEVEFADSNGPDIVPVYSDVSYIPGNWFREKMSLLKPYFSSIEEVVPEEIRKEKWLTSKTENLHRIHFPTSIAVFEAARDQLAYEELFAMQYLGIERKNAGIEATRGLTKAIPLNVERVKEILAKLPFELTEKQKISLFQVLKDMEYEYSMSRLLQGDVGTGKTAVAFVAALHAHMEAGVQTAFMAPTEILARQHFASFEETFSAFGLRSDLLVGGMTKKQKEAVKTRLRMNETDIVFGTHALIEDDVRFHSLGFVVIDEQHRFGVEQRRTLESYYSLAGGMAPHHLNMTATPIPRTLALTLYGDQDLSIINQYPAGRKPILTSVVREHERESAYRAVELQIREGRQVYWVSPLVEESETLDVANAIETAEILRSVFPDYTIGLIHGRMKAKEKDQIMQEFYEGKIQILSSTSVIEVGVNNPNATIMAIEASERFGLSQLHQFRGRVGRGEHQSFCFLFTTKSYSGERLKAMEETNDGFKLSEVDMELRGPGEVYGIRQSGLPDFKIADLRDFDLISEIRDDIIRFFESKKLTDSEK